MTSDTPSRRNVLRAAGTVGLISVVGLSGVAAADHRSYGNGNGVGAFLNDEAAFKDSPIWTTGVSDLTGQSTANVLVGAPTTVNIPDPNVPDALPVSFDPMAVKVSPATDVAWTWAPGVHHSVTSFNPDATNPGDHGQLFDHSGEPGDTFTYTFTDVGNYLYFCHPHGTPYSIPTPIGEVENPFGMRGAIIVADE